MLLIVSTNLEGFSLVNHGPLPNLPNFPTRWYLLLNYQNLRFRAL